MDRLQAFKERTGLKISPNASKREVLGDWDRLAYYLYTSSHHGASHLSLPRVFFFLFTPCRIDCIMDILRRDTNDVIAVPIEVLEIIIKFMDRRTRAELRLCCHRMRKLVTPFVFDKLRIEIQRGQPTERSLASFRLLWLCNYATRSVSIGRGIRPCHDLRPLVRSVTYMHFRGDVEYIRQLLKSCSNLSHVSFITQNAHATPDLHILMGLEQIESLEIQNSGALYDSYQALPEPSFMRHLSLASLQNGSSLRPRSVLNFIRTLSRRTRFERLTSISFELSMCFPQCFYPRAIRVSHASRVACHDPLCHVCPPMPTVQHISVTVPSTFQYPIAYFVHVLSYLTLKFPDAKSLNIHQHNYRNIIDARVPKNFPASRPLDPPHQFWTQLATIDIWHGAHAEIVRTLEYFDIVGPRAARTVNVTIHNTPSSAWYRNLSQVFIHDI
ncbi:hypothetical protein BC940DRAFT_319745 [Gongronella butleri]|nr:hypothetical protein BC940DRAFT_319745 [Gongronella butleri]